MNFEFIKINQLPEIDKNTIYVSDYINLLKGQYTKEHIFEKSPMFTKENGFFDMLCPPDKAILKEEKETLTFYKNLSVSASQKLNIDGYYDCVDTAGEFFKLYKELNEYDIKLSVEYFDERWRREVFLAFEQVKSNMDTFLKQEDYYISFDKSIAMINPLYLKGYKTIIFFNKLSFTPFQKRVIEKLEQLGYTINIILQCREDEFDKENLKLVDFAFPQEKLPEIKIYEIKENLQALLHIDRDEKESIVMKNLAETNLSTTLNSNMCSFPADSFEETKIYKFLDMVNVLLKEAELFFGEVSFRLKDFYDFCHDTSFARYFGIGSYERDILLSLIASDYKYISENILITYFDQVDKENRLLEAIRELSYIYNFSTLEDFRVYFSEEKSDYTFNYERLYDRYSNSFDIFIDEICQIHSIESLNILSVSDELWDGYFELKSEGLLRMILKYLQFKKVSLVEAEEKDNKLNFLDFDSLDIRQRENLSYIGLSEGTIPSKGSDYFLFYESERDELKLPINANLRLKEKFKFALSLYYAETIKLYVMRNEEKNITPSSFVEELRVVHNIDMEELDIVSYRSLTRERFDTSTSINPLDYIEERDYIHKQNTSYMNLSYYAYNNLVSCSYKYFLRDIVRLRELPEISEKMDVRYLGILVHNIFEYATNLIKSTVEAGSWQVNYSQVVELSFKECFNKHPLKYPIKYSSYYEKILFPIIKEALINFYEKLAKLYPQTNKLIAESEIDTKLINIDGVQVYSKGRIDLKMNAMGQDILIDYKTGRGGLRQLDYYSYSLYKKNNTDKYIYSVLDQNLSDKREKYDSELTMEEIEESLSTFLKDSRYRRTESKSNCNRCEYVEICGMRLGE